MRILSFSNQSISNGSVVGIGNFDGVHLGHQTMIKQVVSQAKRQQLASVIVLFEPQPLEFFQKAAAPPRIYTLRQKCQAIKALGVDKVLCLSFNKRMAALSPAAFASQLLQQTLQAKQVVVGEDFRFGHQRAGDFNTLKQLGQQLDFEVATTSLKQLDDAKISSSRVRQLLQQGAFAKAEQLLGRPYRMTGRVFYGQQRGRTINVPTANIRLHNKPLLIRGVYSVLVNLPNQVQKHAGVANIGFRPTVDGFSPQLEVHLFDYDGSLYGQRLSVQIVEKIRDEIKFASFDELKNQIYQDISVAKAQLVQFRSKVAL